jgi:hypothetical protein
LDLPIRSIIAVLLLAVSGGLAIANDSDKARQDFKSWQVSCRIDGYCSAIAGVDPDEAAGAGAGFALKVGRHAQQTYWEISLGTAGATADTEAPFSAAVDARQPEALATEAFGSAHSLYFLGTGAQKLMDQLVHGKAVAFAFTDTAGVDRRAVFRLSGLAAALIWIDTRQHRIGAERVTGAPPYGLFHADSPGAAWIGTALPAFQ